MLFHIHIIDLFISKPCTTLSNTLTTMNTVQIASVHLNGLDVFYRHANPSSNKTILLLHGFPSSSHQYRNLIPLLTEKGYRVIAPDLPGFGFTTVPNNYTYTFANLTQALEEFVAALQLTKFAIYIFDYGAPTGLRLAIKHPEKVAAIVSQNGNAYEEGFGTEFWAPIRKYWATGSQEDRNPLKSALTLDAIKWQYTNGSTHPEAIPPETYHLDHALVQRPGNGDAQLALFYDYRTNVELYPSFQKYFRESDVPVLAIWGRNDDIFVSAGAEAFDRDVDKFELRFLDGGHFAIEGREVEVAESMDGFFQRFSVFE